MEYLICLMRVKGLSRATNISPSHLSLSPVHIKAEILVTTPDSPTKPANLIFTISWAAVKKCHLLRRLSLKKIICWLFLRNWITFFQQIQI